IFFFFFFFFFLIKKNITFNPFSFSSKNTQHHDCMNKQKTYTYPPKIKLFLQFVFELKRDLTIIPDKEKKKTFFFFFFLKKESESGTATTTVTQNASSSLPAITSTSATTKDSDSNGGTSTSNELTLARDTRIKFDEKDLYELTPNDPVVELLPYIRFPLMKPQYFVENVMRTKLLSDIEALSVLSSFHTKHVDNLRFSRKTRSSLATFKFATPFMRLVSIPMDESTVTATATMNATENDASSQTNESNSISTEVAVVKTAKGYKGIRNGDFVKGAFVAVQVSFTVICFVLLCFAFF
ncbi:hypothetical protein RFI_05429, partial [Reticulomyxa filosa]